jgi:hypothetical protein
MTGPVRAPMQSKPSPDGISTSSDSVELSDTARRAAKDNAIAPAPTDIQQTSRIDLLA